MSEYEKRLWYALYLSIVKKISPSHALQIMGVSAEKVNPKRGDNLV